MIPFNNGEKLSLQEAIQAVRSGKKKKECVRIAYDILATKYRGDRLKTITRFYHIFENSLKHIWSKNGFLHCIKANYLLEELLLRSGRFTSRDIRKRWSLIWYVFPHQYLQARIDDGVWIDVDLWAKAYGVPFGDHAWGFRL